MKERIEYLSKLFVLLIGGVFLSFLFFKYLSGPALLFLIAWGVAFVSRRISDPIGKFIKLPKKILRPTVALVLIFSIFAVLGILIFAAVNECIRLLSGIGEGELTSFFEKLSDPAGILGIPLNEEVSVWLKDGIGSVISELLQTLGAWLAGFASSIPKAMLFIIITIIATVYFSAELEPINAAAKVVLPKKIIDAAVKFKDNSLVILLKYLKGYMILMGITFVIILVGLTAMRVEYAVLLAALISLLDLLPIIGVGTILIPYGFISIAFGNQRLGIGLLVLFLINAVVRQLAEPKILGKSLGIHPLITLIMMYFCYNIFGAKGLLIVPILAVIINTVLIKIRPSEVK